MYTFRATEDSEASYEEIRDNLSTHPKLKNIYACSQQGTAFFLYKGCTREVLSLLPGGEAHIVRLKSDNPLLDMPTTPGVVYIFGYT
jgi:hypothetical protein